MKQTTVRVMLAEDNAAIRAGIRRLLNKAQDIEVVGEVENGAAVMRLLGQIQPDVLLLDIEMPLLNGIDVARQLKGRNTGVSILVLSYLVKDEAPERIVEAVREVARGQIGWVSPQVRAELARFKRNPKFPEI
jgi:DNA-binding NarL/FixJ family response regulator